ncbi:Polyisoprenyl-teichoic acid--peptidoglycan teichoic acid transferase TagU [Paenibacillus plantiphilus]|uniref:Polyisoprenyl-teichoic acid--peptidoglycan teichoic acid transferase TagU n=1 Tax=Paenibacillus plantiphilus TaxID=2905650 RepID=A0ABM9CDM8_9BACL|nr:LCP family protein [Paenibacillus plantiphilus]CAH1210895.1 Polyisoprenyl-teichoic acid--peptidoglycan teichoic acid transferase TagU [Paenibacillus plantiphilus]
MNRTWKKIIVWSGSIFLFSLLLTGGYVWYLYASVEKVAAQIYEEAAKPVYQSKDPEVKLRVKPVQLENRDSFTVLVLGVDERKNDRGRSDTMIVLSVNPTRKSMLMFNIPRDTRTEIVGRSGEDKINHAYAFGGIEMSIHTVEHFLDYPIDYYMKVNMEGFARLIDLIGGVKVDNPLSFTINGHQFKKGDLSLNGSEALLYSRMRYDDPKGDLGRNGRQREILQQIMRSSMSLSTLTRVQDLLNEVGDSIKTNLSFEDLKTFISDYSSNIQEIKTVEIKGKGQMIHSIWYYIVDAAERDRIHSQLKKHLNAGQ